MPRSRFAPLRERALRDSAAAHDVAMLGVGPAEVGLEPPVVAVVGGEFLADLDASAIVIGHAGEENIF